MAKINQLEFLNSYFDTTKVTGSLAGFILDLIILIIMSFLLTLIYQKFASSLSNRKKFAANFILLSLTTMMIISVIRSSLALSLGLVGALSIIRFRSAIKEPEELSYIFLAVSLGLAFGAGQREVAIVFFVLISAVIIVRALFSKKFAFLNSRTDDVLYLNLKSSGKMDLGKIEKILDESCHFIDLKRVDETSDSTEYLFLVKLDSLNKLITVKESLLSLDKKINLTILNDEGLFS
jgi:uncharacterized membrane protein YhiD involved in acid resistance